MALQFHVPDEYVQGLLKASEGLLRAFGRTEGKEPLPAAALPAVLRMSQLQGRYWQQQLALGMSLIGSARHEGREPVVASEPGDRRFHGKEWRDNVWPNLLKQSYLLNSQFLAECVEATDVDEKEKHKLRFFARQFIDSMSPANFAATNPEAWKMALESGGESVRAGFANLLADLERGRISITDESAFEVGRNVAVSAGAVVFENELFQLIQYAPITAEVASRPLLIVPPCINKFYILDLQPENSFVRFANESGLTVFLVSWRNPGPDQGNTTWDDYIEHGAMKALEVARAIASADKVNAVGWCVGGTILASTLAVLRARGNTSVASMTLLTTMLDFADPGDLGVFIDEQGVAQREQAIGSGGIYPGSELGFVFQTLRANDLIWPNVVNNYLKGKSPDAFDLLYWNADSTNLPGPMYAWYLRNMYLENNLKVPNRLTMSGTAVDLRKIDMPSYVFAAKEDHIVPWNAAYRTTQLVGGRCEFVLGASGHIAGVINPPSKNRRSYWVSGNQGHDEEAWLASANQVSGSWWPHWMQWLRRFAGKQVPAPEQPGSEKHKAIEPAPGRYVQARSH